MNIYEETWMKYYLGYEEPSCLVRIGPMGSGKTSAVDKFLENHLKISSKNYMLIDIDNMVVKSNEYQKGLAGLGRGATAEQLNNLWYDTATEIKAYEMRDNITLKIINKKRNYSVESTGNYFCPNKELLWKNFTNGYRMIIIFPFVTFKELVDRVRKRATVEGRNVDVDSLKENYINAYKKIFRIISLPVDFYLIDNMVSSGEVPTLLASTNFNRKSDATDCIKGNLDIAKIVTILTDLNVSNEDMKIKSSLFTFFNTLVKYIDPNALADLPSLNILSGGGSKYKKKYETYKKKYLELKKSIN